MRFLRTNTAARITVGPFLDKTDGITPEVALTVTAEKLTLMVDDANVPTLVLDVAPTASGGANDMVHVTGDDAGFYDLELAAANVNFVGRALLGLNDVATHCPVFHEFMILPAAIYDWLILGTVVPLPANVTQWLGTAAATPTVAGVPEVDVTHMNGTAVTAAAGIPEVKVASLAVNAITAAAIAADAITAAKVADGTIDAATFAAGALTAAALAADAGTEIAAAVLAAAVTTPIDANIQKVNDVTIVGDGSATPWGP